MSKESRDLEHTRITRVLAELIAAGVTIHKIGLLLDRPFKSVQRWLVTGRVESGDAIDLDRLHRVYCASNCLVRAETVLNSTVVSHPSASIVGESVGCSLAETERSGNARVLTHGLGVQGGNIPAYYIQYTKPNTVNIE